MSEQSWTGSLDWASNIQGVLDALKKQETKFEHLLRIPAKKLIEALTFWPECWVSWKKPSGKIPEHIEDAIEMLWSKVMINRPKMLALFGPNGGDIYYRLYKSRAIFPDGTYNANTVDHLITLAFKEKSNGK